MGDKTMLAMPGKKMQVPKPVKRTIQTVAAVVLTSMVALAIIAGNALLLGKKGSSMQGVDVWLAFINRADILATMILTAFVTVMFVYWQRDQERR
jgi:hypothetical protein